MTENATRRPTSNGDFNQATIIGRFVADPELNHTQNGLPFVTFTLAVNRVRKDAQGVAKGDCTYIDVSQWGPNAEATHQFCYKGRQVLVQGPMVRKQFASSKFFDLSGIAALAAKAKTGVAVEALREAIRNAKPATMTQFEVNASLVNFLGSSPRKTAGPETGEPIGDIEAVPDEEAAVINEAAIASVPNVDSNPFE